MKTEHFQRSRAKTAPGTLLDIDDGVDPAPCSVKATYSDPGLALAYTLYLADTTDHTP